VRRPDVERSFSRCAVALMRPALPSQRAGVATVRRQAQDDQACATKPGGIGHSRSARTLTERDSSARTGPTRGLQCDDEQYEAHSIPSSPTSSRLISPQAGHLRSRINASTRLVVPAAEPFVPAMKSASARRYLSRQIVVDSPAGQAGRR